MKKKFVFALPLTLGSIVTLGPALADEIKYSLSYGPTKADVDHLHETTTKEASTRTENVDAYFKNFGAPYAQYNVGDRMVYRWGSGSTKVEGDTATLVHDELLVTTDPKGSVLDVTYRRKFADKGPAALVLGGSEK